MNGTTPEQTAAKEDALARIRRNSNAWTNTKQRKATGTISERTRVKLGLPELVDGLRYTRKVGGALYLHCQECGKIIADSCDPCFRLSSVKWMHESGMHHHTFYICRGDENELPRPN